jgi:hypothetical protein
MPKII